MTYTIQDANGRRYYVDEYSPEEYYVLSEYAEIPVYVKTFKKRTGDIGYSFCVQTQDDPTRGEHFWLQDAIWQFRQSVFLFRTHTLIRQISEP